MPKIYSDADKERLKKQMLHNGLECLARQGYKSTSIAQIIGTAGVSKSLFYKLFPSKEQFVLLALEEQQELLCQRLADWMATPGLSRARRIRSFLLACAGEGGGGVFSLSQKEQVQVFEHLSPARFAAFQEGQQRFFARLLALAGPVPPDSDPCVLGNLTMLFLLLNGSAAESLPFLFPQAMPETGRLLAGTVCQYLAPE